MEKKESIIISTTTQNSSEKTFTKKWKKCIDDYYNYTKEYIKHYKKSLQDDAISLSIYPYMKVRSEALYEELYNAQQQSLLTENQVNEIYKIQMMVHAENIQINH